MSGFLQSQDETKKRQQMGPILLLYYEEMLVSSILNPKLIWFHSVNPNVHTWN